MTATEPMAERAEPVECSPGIYPGMDRATYNRIDAVSQSMLKPFRRSPAHALERILRPQPETDSMRLGTLIHCYLLESDEFGNRYVELPDLTQGILTKAGKPASAPKLTDEYKAKLAAFGQQHPGKAFVQPEEMELLRDIGDAIAAHSTATSLLGCAGGNEVAVVWEDPETGLMCKALLDRLCTLDGERIIVDVKTSEDASLGAFVRSSAALGNHFQTAYYLSGLAAIGKPAHRFLHLCVETSRPNGVAVYELDDESINQGLREIRAYLVQYAECKASGHWPAYSDSIQAARLPRYALNNE